MTKPRILPKLPQVKHIHDYTQAAASGNGCPSCDDYPDFPATHCGRPNCRDQQIIAYAKQIGLNPTAALDDATRQAQAARAKGHDGPDPDVIGLCGTCVMVEACMVGSAIAGTAETLGAQVSQCSGYKERP